MQGIRGDAVAPFASAVRGGDLRSCPFLGVSIHGLVARRCGGKGVRAHHDRAILRDPRWSDAPGHGHDPVLARCNLVGGPCRGLAGRACAIAHCSRSPLKGSTWACHARMRGILRRRRSERSERLVTVVSEDPHLVCWRRCGKLTYWRRSRTQRLAARVRPDTTIDPSRPSNNHAAGRWIRGDCGCPWVYASGQEGPGVPGLPGRHVGGHAKHCRPVGLDVEFQAWFMGLDDDSVFPCLRRTWSIELAA